MRRLFVASLFVTFVLLSILADRGASQRVITGTVTEFHAGDWISITNEQTDRWGVQITLREGRTQHDSAAGIEPGVRVTVWYRSVGERRPVADKVRVLAFHGFAPTQPSKTIAWCGSLNLDVLRGLNLTYGLITSVSFRVRDRAHLALDPCRPLRTGDFELPELHRPMPAPLQD